MREKQQNERAPRGGEVETETGERLKGPKPLNVQQQQGGTPNAKQQGGQHVTEGDEQQQQSMKEGPAAYAPRGQGEKAFPDRDPAKKKTGEF